MSQYLEDNIPVAAQTNPVSTAKNFSVGGTLAVTGAASFTSSIAAKKPVIAGSASTVTLTAAQSGSVCLFDSAAGIVYTLPTASAGLVFDFYATVSVTSNSYKVITSAGTELLIGTVVAIDTDTSNAVSAYTGNGTTHVAVTQAAASTNATGGLLGSAIRFTCLSTTRWLVSGVTQAAGAPATPFATS